MLKKKVDEYHKEVDDFMELSDTLITKQHDIYIKSLADINVSTTNNITNLPKYVSKYTRLYSKGMHLLIDGETLLEAVYYDLWVNIKRGSHDLSNITMTATELTKLIPATPSYSELSNKLEHLERTNKEINKLTTVIGDFSFHYKTKLDWLKFLEAER